MSTILRTSSTPTTCNTTPVIIRRTPSGSVARTIICCGLMSSIRHRKHRRHGRQNVGRDPAVCRADPHLAPDAEALAHDRGQPIEHLRQIAAGFALREHGGHEEAGVERRNTLRERSQRVGQLRAVVLALVEQLGTPVRPVLAVRLRRS